MFWKGSETDMTKTVEMLNYKNEAETQKTLLNSAIKVMNDQSELISKLKDQIGYQDHLLLDAERPTGKWEKVPYRREDHGEIVTDGYACRCSNCGNAEKRNQPDMRFCPNCGARMEG